MPLFTPTQKRVSQKAEALLECLHHATADELVGVKRHLEDRHQALPQVAVGGAQIDEGDLHDDVTASTPQGSTARSGASSRT